MINNKNITIIITTTIILYLNNLLKITKTKNKKEILMTRKLMLLTLKEMRTIKNRKKMNTTTKTRGRSWYTMMSCTMWIQTALSGIRVATCPPTPESTILEWRKKLTTKTRPRYLPMLAEEDKLFVYDSLVSLLYDYMITIW